MLYFWDGRRQIWNSYNTNFFPFSNSSAFMASSKGSWGLQCTVAQNGVWQASIGTKTSYSSKKGGVTQELVPPAVLHQLWYCVPPDACFPTLWGEGDQQASERVQLSCSHQCESLPSNLLLQSANSNRVPFSFFKPMKRKISVWK